MRLIHKKIVFSMGMLAVGFGLQAQENVYPVPQTNQHFVIANATIHVGNGQVIDNGSVEIKNGKIVNVSNGTTTVAGAKTIDATGKHVYPGLILPSSDLGLKEIGSGVRGSNDVSELGDLNPSIRSIVAYNTDSKIINTLKGNGILLASITPEGGTISGSSSVVQLDAWNYEDAGYKLDNGIHLNMPSFQNRQGGRRGGFGAATPPVNQEKIALEKMDEVKTFLRQAKAYQAEKVHAQTNLKLEAVKGLFDGSQKLFVHANQVKQMLVALDFVKEFGMKMVIVGGTDSYQIADLLQQNNVAVILDQAHNLPQAEDDDIDQPYKTAAMLQKAGVLFALNDTDAQTRYRNLPFNAGTTATYGLTKEQALQAITLNTAKILGIENMTGSIEAGKDANIIISAGDILDMRTNLVEAAFIQGRQVSLDNKQKQLNERYKYKYGL